MKFSFETDDESRTYAESIVHTMTRLFGISLDEAVGRLNQTWEGLVIRGRNDLIYREDEEAWAKNIYFGKDSNWWLNPPNLKPKPYP